MTFIFCFLHTSKHFDIGFACVLYGFLEMLRQSIKISNSSFNHTHSLEPWNNRLLLICTFKQNSNMNFTEHHTIQDMKTQLKFIWSSHSFLQFIQFTFGSKSSEVRYECSFVVLVSIIFSYHTNKQVKFSLGYFSLLNQKSGNYDFSRVPKKSMQIVGNDNLLEVRFNNINLIQIFV